MFASVYIELLPHPFLPLFSKSCFSVSKIFFTLVTFGIDCRRATTTSNEIFRIAAPLIIISSTKPLSLCTYQHCTYLVDIQCLTCIFLQQKSQIAQDLRDGIERKYLGLYDGFRCLFLLVFTIPYEIVAHHPRPMQFQGGQIKIAFSPFQ